MDRDMSRALPLLLCSAVALGACARGGDEPTKTAAPAAASPGGAVADASSRSTFQLDAPAIAEVGDPCLFRQRKDPVMQAHRDRTGASWHGEVRVRDVPGFQTKWLPAFDKRVATVIARPRVDTFRVRIDANCYDAARKSYHSCSKVLESDLSAIRGFARAPTTSEAGALAVQLCERKVAEAVEKSIEIAQDNQDLKCRRVQEAWCDLPAAPPVPPAAKKK
jgi:hypothetical protein